MSGAEPTKITSLLLLPVLLVSFSFVFCISPVSCGSGGMCTQDFLTAVDPPYAKWVEENRYQTRTESSSTSTTKKKTAPCEKCSNKCEERNVKWKADDGLTDVEKLVKFGDCISDCQSKYGLYECSDAGIREWEREND